MAKTSSEKQLLIKPILMSTLAYSEQWNALLTEWFQATIMSL